MKNSNDTIGNRIVALRLKQLGHRVPVAVRSKAQICGRSIAGTTGVNPAEGMGVRFLCLLCVV
jgi:hypothetical protein